MSFFKSIKNAFGGSDEDYDVFGQPTTFVNPFSKDKAVEGGHDKDELQIKVDQHEEYALDSEFADKAARLMNEHTKAVIDMLKVSWKNEREELLKKVEEAEKVVDMMVDHQRAQEWRDREQDRVNEKQAAPLGRRCFRTKSIFGLYFEGVCRYWKNITCCRCG